ncbi:hypothetical protein C8J57DRAFT_1192966 [Mycena rebaudengoi]|nr:hypothetical protein C8J57DRAFT_1192966 [Mycena rebaudengoi]
MGASAEYTPLDADCYNESQDDFQLLQRKQAQRRLWLFLGNGAVLFMSIVFVVVSRHLALKPPTNAECIALLSVHSPAHPAIRYHPVEFNGTFDFPSIYRGTPTTELDDAWDRISVDVRPTRIDKSVLSKIGKKETSSLVKFREEDGGGFMGGTEVFHQLHCLARIIHNLLRKYTYHEYYEKFDHSFQEKPDTVRAHVDHCTEMESLRMNLMCSADVGMITYEWVQNWTVPYPDFNTVHQCRDFDTILEWHVATAVHIPASHLYRLEGQMNLPIPP